MQHIPALHPLGLRECQTIAINNLEQSFRDARPRALVQMATGSGKTFTAITSIYRLLKHADAKRVLFLVDTRNLGEQAEQEFRAYTPNDDNRKFTELYNVQRLQSSSIASNSQLCITTIQRLYSILKGEELDPSLEEENPAEKSWQLKEPVPVAYNPKVPPEFFDFIVIDECHRSIYNLWQQVLDYFDAFLIGLTATPDKRTFGFFNENIVSEYSHERAVADGVNVGYSVYLIETEITKNGAGLKAREFVDKREKLTRRKRWELISGNFNCRQSIRDIVQLKVPYCSPQEQSQIVQEIETRRSVCDNIESTIRESLEKAEALRQSILKKAFEGKLLSEDELQITRSAPDWEPAEKLLERIRAEKRTARNKH
jgi:type I restriction enzyme, R subunit